MNDAHPSTRRHAWAWCAWAFGLSLSAPAHTWAHEGSAQTPHEGWRQAKVVSLLDPTVPEANTHIHQDCRSQAGAAHAASAADGGRHVLASYSYGGNPNLRRQIVVPVSASHPLKAGDAVHVHISDCQAAAH